MPVQKPPEVEDVREFEEYIFNGQNLMTRRAEVKFKYAEGVAQLGRIKSTKNKRYLCL